MSKKLMTGNSAAAYGVLLANPDVVPVYPITPSSSISEKIVEFVAKGMLNARIINVESEQSSISACLGASMTGARVFTATSSQGLALMHEILFGVSGFRLPVVMVNVNRSLWSPWNLWADHSDSLAQRDTGWLQFYCESGQEALDTVIQSYKISEDRSVLLPTMINLEGFILSHTTEPVDIPSQELVDKYLPKREPEFKLDISDPHAFGAMSPDPEVAMEMKRKMYEAMERVNIVAQKADNDFYKLFGRRYGVIERYGPENPDTMLVTVGTITGTARETINRIKNNEDIGLLKIKMFRPFPSKEINKALEGVKSVAVIDKNGGGIFAHELKSAVGKENLNIRSFIAGVGGKDVTPKTINDIISNTFRNSESTKEPVWMLDKIKDLKAPNKQNGNRELMCSGHTACPGCGGIIAIRHIVKTLGHKTIVVVPACCFTVVSGPYPTSALGVPLLHTAFEVAASAASGVRAGLDAQRDKETIVLVIAGDGGTYDIGLQALSGAAERNENIIYVCYNNQAYMNTGIQASGATPTGAWTTTSLKGKLGARKNLPEIMAAHRIPYVATASISHLDDLIRKVKKAKEINRQGKGTAYLEVLCPCPSGWKYVSNLTIDLARMAVKTGAWPLYEIENGEKRIINYEPEDGLSIKEYLKLQGRFKGIQNKDEIVKEIQENVDKEMSRLKKLSQL